MSEVVANVQKILNDWLDGPIIRIGANDVPWPYNKNLEAAAYPSSEIIADSILEKTYKKFRRVFLAKEITMPSMGADMTESTIVKWLSKKEIKFQKVIN